MTAKNRLPAVTEPHSYMPQNFTEAMQFCEFLAKSDFVPKAFKSKPGDIMACIQFGGERGIPPMQALTNIQVINGRPSMYGDLQLAMVQRVSGLLVHHKEYFELDAKGSTVAAVCEVQRRGEKDVHVVRFSVDDAQRAGLLNKDGPWKQYPKRMLMWRARGFALRDKFADALGGLISTEEAIDMPGGAVPDEINRHLAEQAEIEEAEVVGEARPENVAQAGEPDAVGSDDAHGQAPASPVVLAGGAGRSDREERKEGNPTSVAGRGITNPPADSFKHAAEQASERMIHHKAVGAVLQTMVDEADGKPGVSEGADAPAHASQIAMVAGLFNATVERLKKAGRKHQEAFATAMAEVTKITPLGIPGLRQDQIEACALALQGL